MVDVHAGLRQTAPAPGEHRWLARHRAPCGTAVAGSAGAKPHLRSLPALPQVREPLQSITRASAARAGVLLGKRVSDKVSGFP